MPNGPFDRLREVCGDLPETVEGATVHHPNVNVRGKLFVI